jgi:hypothetical protein
MPLRHFPDYPGAEIMGYVFAPYTSPSQPYSEEARQFFSDKGYAEFEPMTWYPLSLLSQWYNHLEPAYGEGATSSYLVACGVYLANLAVLPDSFSQLPFDQIMTSWGQGIEMNYRQLEKVYAQVEFLGPTHAMQRFYMPHPDDYLYGISYGLCKRLLPPGHQFTIYFDETKPRRDYGGEETFMHVEW